MRALPMVALVLLVACSPTTPATQPAPTPTSPAPAPSPVISSAPPTTTPPPVAPWVVGASPLPLRPDGFGKVLPTPAVLRNRQLQAKDTLPPPADGAFHFSIRPITPSLAKRMGDVYRPGCPVPLSKLSYVLVSFRGFDRRAHTGELVVATSAATKTVNAFRTLFALDFPIEQMRIATAADVRAKPTGDGNDTVGFVCRAARGQKRFSAHSYGVAIDVNPFQNPFVRGDLVLPELASAYAQRSWVRRGMFLPGSAAVRAFTSQGFTWGGTFSRPKDYQHMSLSGT